MDLALADLKDLALAVLAMADLRSWSVRILSASPKILRLWRARSLALDLGAPSAWILAAVANLKDLVAQVLAKRVDLKDLKDLARRAALALADLRSWRVKILSASHKISRLWRARSLALDLGAWSAWILTVANLKDLAPLDLVARVLAGRVEIKDLAGRADLRSWRVRILKPCKIFGASFSKCERSSKRGVCSAKRASTLDLLVAPRQGLGRIHLGGLKRRFCRAPFLSHRG